MQWYKDADIPVNPSEDLFKFLNTGVASSALTNFLTKELYDNKFLQKLDEGLTAAFGQAHDLLLESTQNVLERLTLLLRRLISLCRYMLALYAASTNTSCLDLIQSFYGRSNRKSKTYTKWAICYCLPQPKQSLTSEIFWCGWIKVTDNLNLVTIKSQDSETETENIKSYLNKYTVDVARLREFLKDENRFRLKNLHYILTGKWDLKTFGDKYQVPEGKQSDAPKLNEFCLQQRKQNYDLIEYELGLSSIELTKHEKMQTEPQRRSVNEIA